MEHQRKPQESGSQDPSPEAESGKTLVGLSGGAASAVAAALLHSQNRELQAVWINLGGVSSEDPSDPLSSGLATRCFDPSGRERSQKIARVLGIDWHEIDARDQAWSSVVDAYVHSRMEQKTFHPCVSCLSQLRVPLLVEWARRHGCRKVALGARARVAPNRETGLSEIRRAVDRSHDQSWRLALLGARPEDLDSLELPLGELPQAMVDRLLGILSEKLGESMAMDPHAVGLESVACGSSLESVYRVLQRRVASAIRTPGVIRSSTGGILSEHAGLPTWALGQPIPMDLQNLTLEPVGNAVAGSVDGRAHILNATSLQDWTGREWVVEDVVWLSPHRAAEPLSVRLVFPSVPFMDEALGGGDGIPGHWIRIVENRGQVHLAPPHGGRNDGGIRGYRMIQGQPVVVYDTTGEQVLGAARIFRKLHEN